MSMIKEKTIRELVNRVAASHVLDVNDGDRVKYQDLIGHATLEENAELANDPALNETFYWIYGAAYGTTAAIKFYLNNSNKIAELQADLEYNKDKVTRLEKDLEEQKQLAKTWEEEVKTESKKLAEARRDMDGTVQALEMVRKENIELKAKLYDLLQKGA